MGSNNIKLVQLLKNYHSSDCILQFVYMKLELLVIVYKSDTVNKESNFALTAHHILRNGALPQYEQRRN